MTDTPSHAETRTRFGKPRPKVPAFARYKGTSAWRKDRKRVRAYALHLRTEEHRPQAAAH